MIRIKEQFVGRKVSANGITYDLNGMSQERLKRIYDGHIEMRQFLEEEQEVIQIDEATFFTAVEFDQIIKEAVSTAAYSEEKKTKKKK
jgi:hypothetical protein